jgi:hypothetical protein
VTRHWHSPGLRYSDEASRRCTGGNSDVAAAQVIVAHTDLPLRVRLATCPANLNFKLNAATSGFLPTYDVVRQTYDIV